MVRIRTGAGWRHDPSLLEALRRGAGAARVAAARAAVDALAVEVDGVDVAAGLAEGPILPTLEALLRAVARIVGGAGHATVAFPESEVELLIRRRGAAALLSVVVLSRPSRVVARDVEVEVEALAAAALDASAELCRELAALLPGSDATEIRPLRAAARALRRTETASPPRPGTGAARRRPRAPSRPLHVTCTVELEDDDELLEWYQGGRPDLGSLLGPGRVALRDRGGSEIAAVTGLPFLVLRDLGSAVDALLRAVRTGERSCTIPLARPGRAPPLRLEVDLARGAIAVGAGPELACEPLELARAFAEAQAELGRVARARNPRQAENAHVAELERAAAERLAQIEELAEGDRARPEAGPVARPPAPRVAQRPLGPGRLRRLAFRRTFRVDGGAPAGEGLLLAGGVAVVAGASAVLGLARSTGEVRWQGEGASFAALAAGGVLVARGETLASLAVRTGRERWRRPLPGACPSSAALLARGPVVLLEPGAATALDPASGRTLWRLEPPGAARLAAAPFGGLLALASDAGALYGVDAAGRIAWRVRAPGPLLRAPVAAAGLCLVVAASDPTPALLAVDPSSGARRWQVPLDVTPACPPCAWGRRIAVSGAVGGDPVVTVLEPSGAPAWSVAPALDGPVSAVPAGPLLVARSGSGALVALDREGAVRWLRPGAPDRAALHAAPAGAAPPAIARGTVVAPSADGIQALDVRTGEIVGAVAGAAPVRLAVDASLGIAALDADGLATGWRLATHLSVV